MAESKKKGYVKVRLPRARTGEERDLFVGINGTNYVIPKGVEVEVPDFVAAEIERSQAAEDFMYDNQATIEKNLAPANPVE